MKHWRLEQYANTHRKHKASLIPCDPIAIGSLDLSLESSVELDEMVLVRKNHCSQGFPFPLEEILFSFVGDVRVVNRQDLYGDGKRITRVLDVGEG